MQTKYCLVSFSITEDRSIDYKKYVRIESAQNWLKKQLQNPFVDFISIRKVRKPDETFRNNHKISEH